MERGTIAKGAGGLFGLELLRRYLTEMTHEQYEASGAFRDVIALSHLEHILRRKRPPLLELSGILSTMLVALRFPPLRNVSQAELITLADGGTVRLTWMEPGSVKGWSARPRGLVLILPGLGNTSYWAYIRMAMIALGLRGLRAVCCDYRGYASLPLTSPRMGAADSWKDLGQVLRHLESREPSVPLFAMGFSLGGLMLAKYLSENEPHTPQLAAAVTISSPYTLSSSMRSLETGLPSKLVNAATVSLAKLQFVSHMGSPHLAAANVSGVIRSMSLRAMEETTCRSE